MADNDWGSKHQMKFITKHFENFPRREIHLNAMLFPTMDAFLGLQETRVVCLELRFVAWIAAFLEELKRGS